MKQVMTLGALSAGNIGLAFLFQWYIFIKLGPGAGTDALFAGMTIPQLVLVVISDSLMHVLVPMLAGEDMERFRHDAWGFFLLAGAAFSAFALLLYMTAPWWVSLIVPGFTKAGQDLTVDLTRIQLAGMVFTALSGVQWAVYHARQQFVWPELSPFLGGGLAFLLLIWALPRYGVVAAAWISTLRSALQTVLMMPAMGAFVRPDFRSPAMQDIWRRIRPLLIGNIYYKTDPLVDRFLLSMSGAGTLSLYYLGQQFFGAGSAVLNRAMVSPLVPQLSILYKSGQKNIFMSVYRKSLFQNLIITSLIIASIIVIGQPLLKFMIGWGAFRVTDVSLLWLVMLGMSGVFIGGSAGQITTSVFYAAGNTRTPTRLSMISYSFFIPVKIASFFTWGVMGIAIATSVYYLFNLAIQALILSKEA